MNPSKANSIINDCQPVRVNIKPLSSNDTWRGRRFKTNAYKVYSTAVTLLLPKTIDIPSGPLKVSYEFGLSSNGGDIDNPIKSFTDIIAKKYHFNDNRVMQVTARKVIVSKGDEYISFFIEAF